MAGHQKFTLDDLRKEASDFANSNWNLEWRIGQIYNMEFNQGLQNGCPAMQNYCEGFRRIDYFVDAKTSTFFAWHGTPTLKNIASICHHGFSPAKRRRQLYGTGEYFGVVAEDSHNFSGNTDRLIVAQIIKCKYVSTFKHCHVVNNPTDQTYTFTLPVLIITYGSSAQQPIPWIVARTLPVPAPFHDNVVATGSCWKWAKDDSSMEPFDANMNIILEYHYQNYLAGGSHVFTTSPITRYCDKACQSYIVDFARMTQENQNTKFERAIQRTVNAMPMWHWMEDGNIAMPFPKAVSEAIERHYLLYLSQPNSSASKFFTPSISRRNDNNQQVYLIDFPSMKQTNQKTGYGRKVTRSLQTLSNAAVLPQMNSQASSWKWKWIDADGMLEPYSNSISDLIEHHYQLHTKGGPQSFNLPAIRRKCDNVSQNYIIDFSWPMTQINQATGFRRQLTRTSQSQPATYKTTTIYSVRSGCSKSKSGAKSISKSNFKLISKSNFKSNFKPISKSTCKSISKSID